MIDFKPVPLHAGLGRARAVAVRPLAAPPATMPPEPDFLFSGYTGVPGFLEAIAVLTITGAAAWVGIRTGLNKKEDQYVQVAGWIGGVGAALIGVLYLGAKSGVGSSVGLPAVRVSPS